MIYKLGVAPAATGFLARLPFAWRCRGCPQKGRRYMERQTYRAFYQHKESGQILVIEKRAHDGDIVGSCPATEPLRDLDSYEYKPDNNVWVQENSGKWVRVNDPEIPYNEMCEVRDSIDGVIRELNYCIRAAREQSPPVKKAKQHKRAGATTQGSTLRDEFEHNVKTVAGILKGTSERLNEWIENLARTAETNAWLIPKQAVDEAFRIVNISHEMNRVLPQIFQFLSTHHMTESEAKVKEAWAEIGTNARKIISMCKRVLPNRAVTQNPPPPPAGDLSGLPTIDEDEAKVLNYLNNEYPQVRFQADIESATRISRKTIGISLKKFMNYNLVSYPKDKKKGWVITPNGKEYVDKYLS